MRTDGPAVPHANKLQIFQKTAAIMSAIPAPDWRKTAQRLLASRRLLDASRTTLGARANPPRHSGSRLAQRLGVDKTRTHSAGVLLDASQVDSRASLKLKGETVQCLILNAELLADFPPIRLGHVRLAAHRYSSAQRVRCFDRVFKRGLPLGEADLSVAVLFGDAAQLLAGVAHNRVARFQHGCAAYEGSTLRPVAARLRIVTQRWRGLPFCLRHLRQSLLQPIAAHPSPRPLPAAA
jgi:hypothetical protein